MNRHKPFLIVALLGLVWLIKACVPVEQTTASSGTISGKTEYYSSTALRYEDFIYDPNIKSVQFYVQTGNAEEVFNAPVIPVAQTEPVVLEFDQLNASQQRFTLKFVYCNLDWTEARLTQIQFIDEFNEFYITDGLTSFNTKVPYIHYRHQLPRVKLPGNYLVVVTDRSGNPVLTRRLLVYDNKVTVAGRPVIPVGANDRVTNQQIDFNVLYPEYPVVNPSQEIKVVLRQNSRWDNAKINLRPSFVHDTQKRLEYTFFNGASSFPGLKEYRGFDDRNLRGRGFNVEAVSLEANPVAVRLYPEKNRSRDVYSQDVDINGKVVYENRRFGSTNTGDPDYVETQFTLAAPEKAPGEVFVFGQLSDWKLAPECKLTYVPEAQQYTGKMLLKQGYYNYSFALQAANQPQKVNEVYFEGSHFQTRNTYDILVYYRPPGTRTDLLVGYQWLETNGERR
ncbi:type IX secretion system plug protein [Adhaeribacter pallidiroseus]|uniref:Type 9 secretion system plug protein N-terminal domain-containing protein n=1 Tax=Adhaeribacter pallidiroseus TaxID=2072847 RepID=A0A369QE53_9BACT|nr:DUF5103 domain-containing protein [Adhaeribacter pallidiroseus]RDC62590.1 hypothetical protein AHMF7616_01184 [Adhaeribacter pallidiroseus]